MKEIIETIKQGLKQTEIIDLSLKILRKEILEDNILFSHSLRSALILKKIGLDELTIASGILHHIEPDKTEGELKTILKKVHQLKELCLPTKGLKTKPLKKWQKGFLNYQAENLRRMFFAIAQDLRPIFVTLADKLDEMQNLLTNYNKEEQQRHGLVALEILSPLAYGLGMAEIKSQLEDAVFPFLYPKEYNWLKENIQDKYEERKEYLELIKPLTCKILEQEKIKVLQIESRAKHGFSLYQKLTRYNMDIERIYDIIALRLIVPDMDTCYQVLGILHKNWKPVPGRVKDYISHPKLNGYRALHTTLRCEQNKIVEFQIKTPQMHKEAEYGAAAHFAYKTESHQKMFNWLDSLRQWLKEVQNSKNLADYITTELFCDKVFVFTPKGEVISLPKGATPIDFAYAVHSEIGNHCEGVKIDSKIAHLNQELQTGQTVEIIINNNKTPSLDWLRFVKTHKAKMKIKTFLEKVYGLSFKEVKKEKLRRKGEAILEKILPFRKKSLPLLIGGQTGIQARLSSCCKPREGDELQAFITKGEGASVHKATCPNLTELAEKWPQRIIQATWSNTC